MAKQPPPDSPQTLRQLLEAARTELAAQAPPAWRDMPRVAQALPRRRLWPTALAAFALLLVASTVLVAVMAPEQQMHASLAQRTASFVPVVPEERWARLQDDGGGAWVVSSELAPERLAAYGLPYDPSRATQPVRAELLMRGSGEVLAVRVLY